MPAEDRFFRRGISKAFFVPTITNINAPTVAEVGAGDEMTEEIAELTGWTFSNNPINTPDLSNTFTPNIPGEDTAADSSIVFYENRGGASANPLQAGLAKGTAGFVVLFFDGTAGASPAASDECEVWPVTSTGPYREYSTGNDPARWGVRFATTAPPDFQATVAA